MNNHPLLGTEPITKYLHFEGKPYIPVPDNGPWREALFATAELMGGSTPRRVLDDTLSQVQIYALQLGIYQYLIDNYPDMVPDKWVEIMRS